VDLAVVAAKLPRGRAEVTAVHGGRNVQDAQQGTTHVIAAAAVRPSCQSMRLLGGSAPGTDRLLAGFEYAGPRDRSAICRASGHSDRARDEDESFSSWIQYHLHRKNWRKRRHSASASEQRVLNTFGYSSFELQMGRSNTSRPTSLPVTRSAMCLPAHVENDTLLSPYPTTNGRSECRPAAGTGVRWHQ
jgi:hypothetical protein